MDMKDIAARKDSLYICLQALVDHRSFCDRVHLHAHLGGELVFRDQTAGEKQRVAGIVLLRSRYRFSVRIYLGNRHSFHPFFSPDIHNRMTQFQRNIEIIQTLHNVSFQTAGIRHQLCHDLNLCAFQCHASCHDETDVS